MCNQAIKTIVILGMHRSGTSMMAGVLTRLGVNMGREFMSSNRGNPAGYYENMDFVRLNRRILGHQNNLILPIPSRQEIISRKDKISPKIEALIKKSQASLWGWKDPRTSLTIELFLPFLINPYFIICRRDPLAIAKSLKKRDGLKVAVSLKINNLYNERLADFFKKNPRLNKLFFSYEEMVSKPEEGIGRIVEFIGLEPDQKKISAAAKFILSPWQKKKAKWNYYLKALRRL